MTKAILSQSDRQTIEKHRPNYVFKNFIAKFRYAPKSLPCGNYNIMHPVELLKVPEFISHRNSLSNVGLTGAYTTWMYLECYTRYTLTSGKKWKARREKNRAAFISLPSSNEGQHGAGKSEHIQFVS